LGSLAIKLGAPGAQVLRERCGFVERASDVSIRFGSFRFDAESRELRDADRLVPLSPKAFELLALLVRARPRAVSKAELKDRLWPDSFVGETSLPRVVSELRRALGDRPRQPTFLRTVQRFGYAFAAPAADDASDAGHEAARSRASDGCALLWGERLVPLPAGESLIGRGPDCRLTVPSGLVSRHHARVVVRGAAATLEDLGSKNGTLLRGEPLVGTATLRDGDELRIGPALLVFCAPPGWTTRSRG
jgi:DNA-binding winged helix-turn-helix (wHTH) protein